jgi:hypothetical protein
LFVAAVVVAVVVVVVEVTVVWIDLSQVVSKAV